MTVTETAAAVIPDFGDDDEERKIAFVCSKGTLDMAYPALIMASGALELYDLSTDPAETTDVAAANPEVVKRIENLMRTSRTESDHFPLKRE